MKEIAEEREEAAITFDYDKRKKALQAESYAGPKERGVAMRKLNKEYQDALSPFLRREQSLEQRLKKEKQIKYIKFTASIEDMHAAHSIVEMDTLDIVPAK